MSIPSLAMSSRTYPIRTVKLGSGLNLTEPSLRVASGSREDPVHSSSTVAGVVGEQDDLKRRMDEYMLHENNHKSKRGEDGEEPIEALGSPPQTDMDSYYYSGPPTDLADTASLPRRLRGTPWPTFTTSPCQGPTGRAELPTRRRTPECYPEYVEGSHIRGPVYATLDRTAELLAKLLSGSEDRDVKALSQAVRVRLDSTEPLTKPAMASPSPGLTSLADDLKRSRVSRLLRKVTCPSPFHPGARSVPIAELQDDPVAEAEKKELTALAPLAARLLPPSSPTSGGWKSGKPIAQANIQLEMPEFNAKNLLEWAEEFAEFLQLTGQSHVDVATKCSLFEAFMQKEIFAETGKADGENQFNLG